MSTVIEVITEESELGKNSIEEEDTYPVLNRTFGGELAIYNNGIDEGVEGGEEGRVLTVEGFVDGIKGVVFYETTDSLLF